MSGVIAAMRRDTAVVHITGAQRPDRARRTALLPHPNRALAGDSPSLQAISAWFDLNHQEIAVLTTALALLGFSVVAAILLMRTRVRAARNEARLRADIAELQVQADRYARCCSPSRRS